MEVKIAKQYPVAADLETAWQLLSNIPEMASCMPGAQITEKVDDTRYKGSVRVKVGPVLAVFNGDIEVHGIDTPTRTLRLLGKGADKGGSSVSMELAASLSPAAEGRSTLAGQANVIVNGKFAQFGGRVMTSVSDTVLAQFAATFSEKAQALQAARSGGVSTGASGAEAPPATPVPPRDLNALALVWAVIRDWVAALFHRKT